ncbi:MAG: fatty acid desaturase [Hyphomicrobium sp.]|uniref:fatty acid desaturase n=1 Tax=Hyphomicrobium sp. TaxID=82 RepID=UPI003D0D7ED5
MLKFTWRWRQNRTDARAAMGLLHYKADRINVIRALTAPLFFFYPFVLGFPIHPVLFFLVAFVTIGDMNYILHLHIHHPFTRSAAVNKVLDIALGLVTGMTSANWRIQHKYGHHAGHDDPYVKHDAWELRAYSPLGALSFSLRSIWPTYFEPLKEAFRKGFLGNETRPINYRSAFLEQLAQIGVVSCLFARQPLLVAGYVLPWYVLVYFISRYVDYLNHYGCSDGAYDFANNCLSKSFNTLTHNFGYHTAHHLHAAAHWSELPDLHSRIEASIPQARKKQFSWAFVLMPYHFWRWRRQEM